MAVLVLSGLIFMTLMAQPPLPPTDDASDLHEVADGMVRILEQATVQDPVDGTPMHIEDWVDAIVRGDNGTTAPWDTYGTNVTQEVDELRVSVTPAGLRSMIRLHNGHAALPLVPALGPGEDVTPRSAAVAITYIRPDWTGIEDPAAQVQNLTPGQQHGVTLTPGDDVFGPTGNKTAPAATEWIDWWGTTVPENAPLGLWDLAGTIVQVHLPGLQPDPAQYRDARPSYGIEVVVWRGA